MPRPCSSLCYLRASFLWAACAAFLLALSAGCASGVGSVAKKAAVAVGSAYLNNSDTGYYERVTARCADGTKTTSLAPNVACDAHGGIDVRYDKP